MQRTRQAARGSANALIRAPGGEAKQEAATTESGTCAFSEHRRALRDWLARNRMLLFNRCRRHHRRHLRHPETATRYRQTIRRAEVVIAVEDQRVREDLALRKTWPWAPMVNLDLLIEGNRKLL